MARLSKAERESRNQQRWLAKQRRDDALKAMKSVAIRTFKTLRKDPEWKKTKATTRIRQVYKADSHVWVMIDQDSYLFQHRHDPVAAGRHNTSHAVWMKHMLPAIVNQPRKLLKEWVRVGANIGWQNHIRIQLGCEDPERPIQTAQLITERTLFQCTVWIKKMARTTLQTYIDVVPVLDIIMTYCDDRDHKLSDTHERRVLKMNLE